MCHDSCQETGSVYEVGGGFVAKLRWQRSEGSFFDPKTMSPEEVAKKWSEINDFSRNNDYPTRPDETFSKIMEYRESIKPKL